MNSFVRFITITCCVFLSNFSSLAESELQTKTIYKTPYGEQISKPFLSKVSLSSTNRKTRFKKKQVTQKFYRPTANLEFYESGDVKRGLKQFYLDPQGKSFGVDFTVGVPKKSDIKEFIWQVSSIVFLSEDERVNSGNNNNNLRQPRGLLASGRTGLGKFTVDFAEVARKANLPDAPKSDSVRVSKPNHQTYSVKSVPAIKKKTKRFKRIKRKDRIKSIPQLRIFGDRTFYVRAIPVYSLKGANSNQPVEIMGKPTTALPVFWKKLPPNGLVFHGADEEFALKLTSFEFIPHLLIHNWPKGCKPIPDDDGKTSWEVIQDAPGFINDVINWVSETYASIKSSVITWAARMIPLVDEQMVAFALDAALAAAGIPPSLPNLDQLMSGGADYLAMQVANQIPIPAGGVLAEMAADEARKEIRNRTRKALLEAADEAKKIKAAKVVYCQLYSEMPYLIIKIRNQSSKKSHQNFWVEISDDKRLFERTRINIDTIEPKETLTLPVFFLDKANMVVTEHTQSLTYDLNQAETKWLKKYTSTNFRFKISAPASRDCYGNACSMEFKTLYESPSRDYWDGKAYLKKR